MDCVHSEEDTKTMLAFVIDNIYGFFFGDQVFQQSVDIPLSINCWQIYFYIQIKQNYFKDLFMILNNSLWPLARHLDITTTYYQ